MYRVVLRETTAGNITIQDILSGKKQTFVSVHSAAMLALITNDEIIAADNVPETLLFDVNRLNVIRRDFKRNVDGTVLLTMANHAIIGSDRQPTPEKRLLFKKLLTNLSELVNGDSDFDSIIDTFCLELDSANVLTGKMEREGFLTSLKAGIEKSDDNVRKLM